MIDGQRRGQRTGWDQKALGPKSSGSFFEPLFGWIAVGKTGSDSESICRLGLREDMPHNCRQPEEATSNAAA